MSGEHGGSFIRVVAAELRRYRRRSSMAAVVLGAAVFAAVAGTSVWLSADAGVAAGAERSRDGGASLADLAGAGGATEAFAVGASFGGLVVFVLFIALIGTELTSGTYRTLLLVYPYRARLLLGKMVGLLLVTAGAVALAEVLTVVMSMIMAPSQDVATGEWWTMASVGEGLSDYGTVLAGLAGWAVLGTLLASLLRSVPVALGVGIAWAGPFENVIAESWTPGTVWFPGQVLGSLIRGGTIELGYQRALITTVAYGLAAALAVVAVSRRDVTR